MSHTVVDEWRRCLLFSAKVDTFPPRAKLASTSQLNEEPEDEVNESINNKRPSPREWAKTWRVKRVQGCKCRNLQPFIVRKSQTLAFCTRHLLLTNSESKSKVSRPFANYPYDLKVSRRSAKYPDAQKDRKMCFSL